MNFTDLVNKFLDNANVGKVVADGGSGLALSIPLLMILGLSSNMSVIPADTIKETLVPKQASVFAEHLRNREAFCSEFQSSVRRLSASNARRMPGCTPLLPSPVRTIDDQTMPDPGALPFADSVSTPPDEPHCESTVLCETGGVSNVVPLKWYALKWLQPSDQTYIQRPAPPPRFQ